MNVSELFITFEGIEGSGKTTQLKKLYSHLKSHQFTVIETHEPGGTKIGNAVRAILLNPDNTEMAQLCELMLYEASRSQLVTQVIRPALKMGAIVLWDRFTDSSLAYQGYGRGIPLESITKLNLMATMGLTPQLTFLFDLPVEEGFRRIERRLASQDSSDQMDRLELAGLLFHQKVRDGFLDLAKKEPERIRVIDARQNEEQVYQQILKITEDYVTSRNYRTR